MAEADELQRRLLKAQNPDGGWGYGNGSSWTEPTALALLALEAQTLSGLNYTRGCAWLAHTQRLDGGWAPKPSIQISTWVTSLAVLALSEVEPVSFRRQRAVQWLIGECKPGLGPIERLAFRLRGLPVPVQPTGGSPWFPGTAAWIGPSSTSVLALCEAGRKHDQEKLNPYVSQGREYILSRRCRDGGWNHGGSKYRSENANSYPEMTGLALLALYGLPASDLNVSLKRAQYFLQCPGSMEALAWLQLGLSRHGADVLGLRTTLQCRTTRDLSLRLLVLAGPSPRNKFLPTL